MVRLMIGIKKMTFRIVAFLLGVLLLTSCNTQTKILYSLPEREANEIVVLLATKGIEAEKIAAPAAATAGANTQQMWDIVVPGTQVTDALAVLNQIGLPRAKGTNLLDLFGTTGLVPSDMQDRIRYQEGLSEQLAGTIRKMDGVIDANVQITLPRDDEDQTPLTASVYIRHRGILDNPNSILVTKIKRFVASSIPGMSMDNVSVITDRALLSDVGANLDKERQMISVWGIVLARGSLTQFRVIFYCLIIFTLLILGTLGWLIWKFLPLLEKKGFSWLMKLDQYSSEETTSNEEET